MSHELYYTSLPAGLKPGSNGFCTVAMTAGLPAPTVQRLEMLSGYRELYSPGDPRAAANPVAWSHWRLSPGGRSQSVLSRVAAAGMDYTGRTNIFAHHLLLEPAEQPPAGPAWLISQPGVLDTTWAGSPRVIAKGRSVPSADESPALCHAWAAATGDAGWAGVLAATAIADSPRVAYLIYDPAAGHDPLPLLREAMALLPPARRWSIAFTTYFSDLPAGLACHWRCCVAGTAAAKDARRNATSGIVLDLTIPMGDVPKTALVGIARTGQSETQSFGSGRSAYSDNFSKETSGVLAAGFEVATEDLKPTPLALGGVHHSATALPPRASQNNRISLTPVPISGSGVATSAPARTWVWVVALLWPLLVISAVIAWHVTSESKRNIALEKGLKVALDEIDTVKRKGNQDAATASEAIGSLNAELSQADSDKNDALSKLTESGRQQQQVKKDLKNANETIAKLQQQKNSSDTQPATEPATAPPAIAEVPQLTVAAVSDERFRVLASIVPPFDAIEFINPPRLKCLRSLPVDEVDKNAGVLLNIKFAPDDDASAIGRLGRVRRDPIFGLVFDLGAGAGAHETKDDWQRYLPYCGVALYFKEKVVQYIQFGHPVTVIKLSESDKPRAILPPTSKMPTKYDVVTAGLAEATWTCGSSAATSSPLSLKRRLSNQDGFDITFNSSTGEISTNWTQKYGELVDKCNKNAKQSASWHDELERAKEDKVKFESEAAQDDKDRDQKLSAARAAIAQAQGRIDSADDTAAALADLKRLRSLNVRFSDPSTGFTLGVAKLVRED